MSTINKYLEELLGSQDLTSDQESTLREHKKEVTDFLNSEFGDDAPKIKYAGSRQKGTMIRDSYDLDIVCYFPNTDTRTLKEIRDDVSAHLRTKYFIQSKASAERILNLSDSTTPGNYHIDVVPGRFIEGSDDVFLHVSGGEKDHLQTNLKTHINYITNGGCVPIIRLAKIWAHRNRIEIKTFVLELFVVETLSGSKNKDDLKKSFLKVLDGMKNSFGTIQLIDPANTNNVVSKLISTSTKNMVVSAAETAFSRLDVSDDVDDWRDVLCDNNDKTNSLTTEQEKDIISPEEAAEISLGNYSHKETPPWPKDIQGSVEIKKCVVAGGPTLGSNGWPLTDGRSLNYFAEVSGISSPYEVWWQVVNTGEHAASIDGGLRGKLEKPKNPSRPLEQSESTMYTGRHWVQCYIVKNDYLIAESKPFYLNVVNKTRKKFRARHH